jgi:hypothetical protein
MSKKQDLCQTVAYDTDIERRFSVASQSVKVLPTNFALIDLKTIVHLLGLAMPIQTSRETEVGDTPEGTRLVRMLSRFQEAKL